MGVREAYERLRVALTGEVRLDEPMARHTSLRVGGPADLFCVCETVADLGSALDVLAEEGVEVTVVGKGTNLLVADAGYRGAIITLGREFKRHVVDGEILRAGAACVLAYLVRDAYRSGLAGLAFAVGIPGTLGGAIAGNAGSREEWIGSIVESVTVYEAGGGLRRLLGSDVAWGYRTSDLGSRGVIVEAAMRLREADPDAIRATMEEALERRKRTQPLGVPSAGSTFKNPPGDSAGRLIESVGLKNTRLGGARVSDVHANFIVNEGGATAADIIGLIRKVRTAVRDAYGIELEPEVRFLGRFEGA